LSSGLIEAATGALRGFADDREITVIVLCGEGRAFSAGADVDEMRGLDAQAARGFISHLHVLMEAVRRLPQV